ncbi:hypothetical protein [Cyanobium sp. Morenito 9A2]|uniref:hypothetical protein n=1 Tax=Cyanobium sp. Morenito 9A2 TaxID=2823718 RepID=UPI0020CEC7C1|nr:hypothetical protein [Cyanobium sp. Morenito 9A2]MCP9851214.1 hypothetical protein [Cyanobium sp. Morenito 9A2]
MAFFVRNPARHWLGVLALAVLSLEATAALAQPDLRNTFPGRRIGGGTRGECAARVLAHLVPSDSVFAPGSALTVALLEGPTANPRPLQVQFRPQGPGGTSAGPAVKRELPAAPAGVTLLRLAGFKGSQVWESSFRCDEGASTASTDPLNFVETVAPPALSLLVTEGSANDRGLQVALQKLKGLCGSRVTKAELAQAFGLEEVIAADWPAMLPVRCP